MKIRNVRVIRLHGENPKQAEAAATVPASAFRHCWRERMNPLTVTPTRGLSATKSPMRTPQGEGLLQRRHPLVQADLHVAILPRLLSRLLVEGVVGHLDREQDPTDGRLATREDGAPLSPNRRPDPIAEADQRQPAVALLLRHHHTGRVGMCSDGPWRVGSLPLPALPSGTHGAPSDT